MRMLAPVSGVLLVSAASGQGSALRVPTGLEIILLQYLYKLIQYATNTPLSVEADNKTHVNAST